MSGICRDRVVVTGGDQGLGSEHALAPTVAGARVAVDDPGRTAKTVTEEIKATGGTTAADLGNVSEGAGT